MKMKKSLVVLFCVLVLTVGTSAQDNNKEKNMSESNVISGGWTPYSCDISPKAKKVFDTALKGFVGVKYTPVAVATQVVSGVNYSFFCNAKVVYSNAPNKAAMVEIYKPLEGSPHITSIKPVDR